MRSLIVCLIATVVMQPVLQAKKPKKQYNHHIKFVSQIRTPNVPVNVTVFAGKEKKSVTIDPGTEVLVTTDKCITGIEANISKTLSASLIPRTIDIKPNPQSIKFSPKCEDTEWRVSVYPALIPGQPRVTVPVSQEEYKRIQENNEKKREEQKKRLEKDPEDRTLYYRLKITQV